MVPWLQDSTWAEALGFLAGVRSVLKPGHRTPRLLLPWGCSEIGGGRARPFLLPLTKRGSGAAGPGNWAPVQAAGDTTGDRPI